ncbi:hypothetical protein [Fodinibius sp. Rm-B-1B1-1]|uniref:hypothetical protein n=1 Tax=Fodinibius alkaliphilus TaxID=3140241 RepID=UPI00315ABFC2
METTNKLFKAAKMPAIVTVLLLLVPLVAMLFTNEVVWDETDFIVMGILIFFTGFSYKLVTMSSGDFLYKAAMGLAFITALFLVWSNLAVGIIGSEDNAANLMYFGVVLFLIIGSFIARFQSKGMAYALFGTAFAQALTIGITLVVGMQDYPGSSVYEIIMVNGFFMTLFSVSGGLFWLAAEENNGMDVETSA